MTGLVLGALLGSLTVRRIPPRAGRAVLILAVLFLAIYAGLLAPGATYLVFAAGAAVLLGATLLRPAHRTWAVAARPFLVAGALVAYLGLRDAAAGSTLTITGVGATCALLLLWFLRRALQEGDLTVTTLGAWASMFLALCLVTGGVLGREWIDCRYEYGKCTVAGRIYIGIFPSENVLGMLAAAAGLCVLAGSPRLRRDVVRLGCLLAILLLAGSRTPLLALVIAVAATGVLVLRSRRVEGRWRLPRLPARLLPVAVAGVGVALVFHSGGRAFSNRAAVWTAARAFVAPTSLVGLGENRYRQLGALDAFRGHYPHSEYLLLLFFGGLGALALYAVLLGQVGVRIRGDSLSQLARRTLVWGWLLAYGLVEVSWNAVHLDANAWTLVALTALIAPGDRAAAEASAYAAEAAGPEVDHVRG